MIRIAEVDELLSLELLLEPIASLDEDDDSEDCRCCKTCCRRSATAISHDLRTPIARMRLRTEFIEDDANRQKKRPARPGA